MVGRIAKGGERASLSKGIQEAIYRFMVGNNLSDSALAQRMTDLALERGDGFGYSIRYLGNVLDRRAGTDVRNLRYLIEAIGDSEITKLSEAELDRHRKRNVRVRGNKIHAPYSGETRLKDGVSREISSHRHKRLGEE